MARILVVDDDALIRELLVTVLGDAGHQVAAVGNGEDALKRLAAEPFELVFLDRTMPRLSGLETLIELRKDLALKGVKVIMCTGAGMLADAQDALAAGADDYVVKPLEIERLLEKTAKHAATAVARPAGGSGIMGSLGRLFRPS